MSETLAIDERIAVYNALATLMLIEPNKNLLEVLKEGAKHLPFGLSKLETCINSFENLDEAKKEIGAEYIKAFYSMSANPVSLCESVHTSDEGLVKQESFDQMNNFIEEENLELTGLDNVMVDHVAVELMCMAKLLGDELESKDSAKSKKFFEEHIANWMPELFKEVVDKDFSKFYKIVGSSALDFLETEKLIYA